MKFDLKRALAYAQLNGIEISKKELAKKFWPNSSEESRQVLLSKLLNYKY